MNHFVAVLIAYCVVIYPLTLNASEIDDDEHESIHSIGGQPVILMDDEIQRASGLKILHVKHAQFIPERIVYGKAMSIKPLLTLRNNYFLNISQQAGEKIQLTQSKKEVSRLQQLHQNNIISAKKLQIQHTKWQTNKATYNKNSLQNQIIINNSQLQWGETLTHWATSHNSTQWEKLTHGQSTLVKITLPANQPLPSTTKIIFISFSGKRQSAVKATYITTLPEVDSFSQGEQAIFLTDSKYIKAGAHLTAWVPLQEQQQSGVIIPESSIVWHLGQSFVFIKLDEEHFIHRRITQPVQTSHGYYVGQQIAVGEAIVTTGAQILLSHEFRSQIPDDDDD
jgi:hypothetical protein